MRAFSLQWCNDVIEENAVHKNVNWGQCYAAAGGLSVLSGPINTKPFCLLTAPQMRTVLWFKEIEKESIAGKKIASFDIIV